MHEMCYLCVGRCVICVWLCLFSVPHCVCCKYSRCVTVCFMLLCLSSVYLMGVALFMWCVASCVVCSGCVGLCVVWCVMCVFLSVVCDCDLRVEFVCVLGCGDRKSTRLNSSHLRLSRMPSSA